MLAPVHAVAVRLQPWAEAGWRESRRVAAPVCSAAAPHMRQAAAWADGFLSPLAPWQVEFVGSDRFYWFLPLFVACHHSILVSNHSLLVATTLATSVIVLRTCSFLALVTRQVDQRVRYSQAACAVGEGHLLTLLSATAGCAGDSVVYAGSGPGMDSRSSCC